MRALRSIITVNTAIDGVIELSFKVSELTPDEADKMIALHSSMLKDFDAPDPLQKALDGMKSLWGGESYKVSEVNAIIRTLYEEMK